MKTLKLDEQAIEKILVCQLRRIGDVLLATPSIRLLKERFPRADIYMFTEKKNAELLENNPDLAGILALDKQKLSTTGSLRLVLDVARKGFDLLVDFQQLPRCRMVAGLSMLFGARLRLTYTPPWYNRLWYSHWTTPRDGYAAMSKASVLEPLGIRWNGEPPVIHLRPEESDAARRKLRDLGISPQDTLVTLDPTHNRPTRLWPAESFGRTVRMAAETADGLKFLVLYGPGEEKTAAEVAAAAEHPACVLPGEVLGLRESAAIIKEARLHFGTCSAPRHMAAAVGTPSLAVLGSTSSAWTYPHRDHRDVSLGLECQPCNENSCPDMRCLAELAPEAVLPELLAMLEAQGREC